MTPAEKQITQLYVGYFARAADPAGFDFWLGQANAGGAILDIANSFAAGQEYASIYGGLSNGSLIDKIYDNLFGRAPDSAGKAYWLAQLESGMQSGGLIVNVMSGAQGNDRLTLENTAIIARDWTARTIGFDLAAAHDAIASINTPQPITGNGISVTITDPALLPWADAISASIKAAWHQWEIHFDNQSQIQIDVGYSPISGGNTIASATSLTELLTASGYTQSGVAQEIITGRDPNGNMQDGFINLHMEPNELFSRFDMTSIFAHELGHIIAFRTQINNSNAPATTNYDHLIGASGGTLHFDGPNAVAQYGGPVPVSRIGNFNDYAHFDIGLMAPTFWDHEVRTVGALELAVLKDIGIGVQ